MATSLPDQLWQYARPQGGWENRLSPCQQDTDGRKDYLFGLFPQFVIKELFNHCTWYSPLPTDFYGREFAIHDHFSDLLAGGTQEVRGFLDSQNLVHAHESRFLLSVDERSAVRCSL